MEFSDEQVYAFGVALNEATVVAVAVDPERRAVAVTLGVLSLPEGGGPGPADPRVVLFLEPAGRIAASLRHGRWDDAAAPVEPFELGDLPGVVAGFLQLSLYGWKFLDVPADDRFARWCDRLSLDWSSEPGGLAHTLDLFQASPERILDLRVWFDGIRIFTPDGHELAFDEFTAAGLRWWDALKAGDPRTAGHGIHPRTAE